MGLREIITGKRKIAPPAEDRLFALSTAAVTLDTALQTVSTGAAAIVFQPLSTADFQQVFGEMRDVVSATAADNGATVETTDDSYGFRWLIVRGDDIDSLVVAIHGISDSLVAGGYGERLLCAVFAFKDGDGRAVDWIYNFKRGSFYPFIPRGEGERDSEREMVLRAQIGGELPVEPELERWFPLWGTPI